MRYAEWCTAAPSLEADIAAAAMGLDDIGHSRVLYGSLRELGLPEASAEDARSYQNVPYLDRPWTEWAQFVAANAVLDGAFSLMLEALVNGDVAALRSRLKKMLQEEQYHYLHGRSWMRETDAADQVRAAWTEALAWFGPSGGDVDQLHAEGKLGMSLSELCWRLEERLEAKAPSVKIDWTAWDPVRRRTVDGGIDQATLDMLQGLAEKRYMPVND